MLDSKYDLLQKISPTGRVLGGIFCGAVSAFLFWVCCYFIYLYAFKPRSLISGASYLFIFVVLLLLFMVRVTYRIFKPSNDAGLFPLLGTRTTVIGCSVLLLGSAAMGIWLLVRAIEQRSYDDLKGFFVCLVMVLMLLSALARASERV